MNKLLFLIKILVLIELGLVLFFLLLHYALKQYYQLRQKYQSWHNKKITTLLLQLNKKKSPTTSKKELRHLKHSTTSLFIVIKKMQKIQRFSPELNQYLTEKVFIPSANKLTSSRNWFKRYLAIQCLTYEDQLLDAVLLEKLICDTNFLVSLSASRLALKYPNLSLVNRVIDVYSQRRRLQQSAIAEILAKETSKIEPMIANRLAHETDPYIKMFCYRLLTCLPGSELPNTTFTDIVDKNLDIRIAVLQYLAHLKQPKFTRMIRDHISDENWQIRAMVVKLLGQLKDEAVLPLLGDCLQDKEWWVRTNSAQALTQLGQAGLAILKAQNSDTDRYAYEAAQQALAYLGE